MLQSLMAIESIVFIHDGFLISPEPPTAILQRAQEAILTELSIFDPVQPLFKCVQLTQELAHLEQTHIATPCARVPDLPNATLHSFWRTVSIKRPRTVFSNLLAVDRQETRLTKRRRGSTGSLKRRMLSNAG